jgi:hypothetical protein
MLPTNFPVDDTKLLITYLRNNTGDHQALLEAAYNLLGYSLGRTGMSSAVSFPQPTAPVQGGEADSLQKLVDQYEHIVVPRTITAAWKPPIWLVSLTLSIIQKLLQ